MKPGLRETESWKLLKAHREAMSEITLASLFATDPGRKRNFTFSVQGLEADFSRNHLTAETLSLFQSLLLERDFPSWRARLFGGDKINVTENRAVLHTALRGNLDSPLWAGEKEVTSEIKALQAKMKAFVQVVREGVWLGATGKRIEAVVNIGIGGSDLGPRLVASALGTPGKGLEVRFVANVDPADLHAALRGLNPATTLFIVASKTFTTSETLLNAQTARQWVVNAFGEGAIPLHFVAVSTNDAALESFGIPKTNRFPMWDWVGGRLSVWSSVGLAAAMAIGYDRFRSFLDGAAAMDAHFCEAPLTQNLPVLLALTGIWYRNFWNTSCQAILPYAERLRELPRYLQQLEMESNGKCVTREGEPVSYATAPAIFGECGTVGQHSFHQWLHQGTDLTPADFIGIRSEEEGEPEHHRVLLANLNAQAEALMKGYAGTDLAHTNPGNRPSTTLWLEKLDAFRLGQLLALYEHKVFVQGVVWGINSFDQFGVELGKKMAKEALASEK